MSGMMRGVVGGALAVAVGFAVLFWNGNGVPGGSGGMIRTAAAWVGNPATPMSYAGVARRTTRRAYAAGAAAAAPPPVVVAPAPGCVQVVNPYGQVTYQCH